MPLLVNCLDVTPGEPLNNWQILGLKLVSQLQGGRDVVLAFDLTGSVDFNDEGRTRLQQIVKDSLKSGDRVYVIPFASEVNPLDPEKNPFLSPIDFQGRNEDIDRILSLLPKSSSNLQNTDIQKAEAFIYKGLAQRNQCRFTDNQKIKPQSIVWITDAPLLKEAGIPTTVWKETPATSPFRQKDSPESRDRAQWIQTLPLSKNSQKIVTNNNKSYDLTVVDIAPIVQEFCTPAPGGQKICSVNSYLFNQLWLPILSLVLGITGLGFLFRYWLSLQRPWKLSIEYVKDDGQDKEKFTLKNQRKIYLGGEANTRIDCPGSENRGYLERKGNQLYLVPNQQGIVYYKNKVITKPVKIESLKRFMLNCPDAQERDFEIVVKVTN
ncbi:MAG: vWA domain-containing protein [Snowella sp.]|nr:vWA domain-containing protein [Snowella sp.]